MVRQVGWRAEHAMALEVVGRAAHHQRVGGEFPGDQPGFGHGADAHRQIKALFDQVHPAVRELDVDLDLGVLLEIGRNHRPHVQDAK